MNITTPIILGLSIFISIVLAWILMVLKVDIVNLSKVLTDPTVGWIILLTLQIVYLAMDIAETATGREVFGVIAGGFMMSVGLVILLLGWLEYIHYNNPLNIFHLLEGMFYVVVGITLIELRNLRLKKEE